MEPSLNRRQLLRAAAGTLAAASTAAFAMKPAYAQTADSASSVPRDHAPGAASPAKQPSADTVSASASASDKDVTPTGEGTALANAALAGAGHTLPPEVEAEVHKQLGAYPGSFEAARKFTLNNSDAPRVGVTLPLP